MSEVTLIHPFEVDKSQDKSFIAAWQVVDHYMKNQLGFIETKLHRSIDWASSLVKTNPHRFFNIARWESKETFQNAISTDHFKELVKNVIAYSRGPGLYENICE